MFIRQPNGIIWCFGIIRGAFIHYVMGIHLGGGGGELDNAETYKLTKAEKVRYFEDDRTFLTTACITLRVWVRVSF